MADINQNRPGYKQTKVGWVPEEWEVKKLGDLGELTSGTTPSRSKNERYFGKGVIPWVKTTDLNNGKISTTEESVSEIALEETSLKILPKDTILVAMYGGFRQIGRTGILGVRATINQALSAIIIKKDDVHPPYLIDWLNYKVNYWRRFAASSRKDPNITKKDVSDFPFIAPPLPEQHRIAAILSTWDEAIQTLDRLISQKQELKKGLMQQLLTGRVRFPEFVPQGGTRYKETKLGRVPEEWEVVRLKKVAKEVTERNGETERTVVSCTKYEGFVDSLEYFGKQVYSDDRSNYKVIRKGQFGYPANHIEEGSIGLFQHRGEGVVSPIYVVFETKKDHIDAHFLKHLVRTSLYKHLFAISTSGSVDRRGSLRWKAFSKIQVALPSLKEQERIAESLDQLDKEIESTKKLKESLEVQKKGLMQQLLTGAVRVKEIT